MPGSIQCSKKMGIDRIGRAHDDVGVFDGGLSALPPRQPQRRVFALMSRAKTSRLSALGLKQRIVSIGATAQIAMSWAPPASRSLECQTVAASRRASYLAPATLAGRRTRQAAGSRRRGRSRAARRFSVENSSTRPK